MVIDCNTWQYMALHGSTCKFNLQKLAEIKLYADLLLSGSFHPNIDMRGEGVKKLFSAPLVSLVEKVPYAVKCRLDCLMVA